MEKDLTTQNKEAQKGVSQGLEARKTFSPPVNIYEKDDHLLLVADMPGVDEKGLDITLDRDTLTLHGRSSVDVPEAFESAYAEYATGDYRRSFRLSTDQLQRDGIEAGIKNGVLRVKLPKREKAKPRKIPVQSG